MRDDDESGKFFFPRLLLREKKRLEEYISTVTILVFSSSFEVMLSKRIWNKITPLWLKRIPFTTKSPQSRAEEISQMIQSEIVSGNWKGMFVSILFAGAKGVQKLVVFPKSSEENILKALEFRMSELFPLGLKDLIFCTRLIYKNGVRSWVYGIKKEEIEPYLDLDLPTNIYLDRVAPLFGPLLNAWKHTDFFREDLCAILILEIENALHFYLLKGELLLNCSMEERSFRDSSGAFDHFEWAMFLKGRFRGLEFEMEGVDYPKKHKPDVVVFATTDFFYKEAGNEVLQVCGYPVCRMKLSESSLADPRVWNSVEEILHFGMIHQKFECFRYEGFHSQIQKSWKPAFLYQFFFRHLLFLVFLFLLIVYGSFFFEFKQEKKLLLAIEEEIKIQEPVLGETGEIMERIRIHREKIKKVQSLLGERIHVSGWLSRLASLMPEPLFLKTVRMKKGILEIDGESENEKTVLQFIKALRDLPEVNQLRVEYVNRMEGGNFGFRLVILWNRKDEKP